MVSTDDTDAPGSAPGSPPVPGPQPPPDDPFAAAAERQAYVRHELRTPIAVMRPVLEMLLDGTAGPLEAKQLGYLRMVERNLERLNAMIASVVESGWLEVAALPSVVSPVSIDELVRAAVNDVRASVEECPEIDVVVPRGLANLQGDAHLLSRALRNVLLNACAVTPAGGTVRVSALPAAREGAVEIRVDDSGCGVTSDEAARVFGFGFQGAAGRAREPRGLGLGLYIAREVAGRHGGRIWLESAPGGGTRVSFELPAG